METELFYKEQGTGFPMILLHGNGENCDYFEHQIPYFSKEYRVIAVDTRGHGRSPRGTAAFSISQFADDLNHFMEQLDIAQAILLGFSDGANIAMCFALKHQRKVKCLILNGGNLYPKGVKPATQLPIELGYKIAKLFAKKSESAKRKAELLRLMVQEPNIAPAELKAISVPTLVIAGTRDMIKESHTRLIAASIPNSELTFISGSHFIAHESSSNFNQAVHHFLKSI